MHNKKYYVYEHREADTGRVFYVGKGFGNRKGRMCDRNEYWRRVAKKHGFTSHIIRENMTERDALAFEVDIISAYGRENLCNLTDGGEGVSNPSDKARLGQALGQASTIVYTFYHDYHGEFTGTTFELRVKYDLTKTDGANLRGMATKNRYLSVKGWRMTKEKIPPRKAYIPKPRDMAIYTFINDDIGVFIGDRRAASESTDLYGSQVSNLITGKHKSIKGWFVGAR